MTQKAQNKGTFMMLEKDDVRYEFFTRPVRVSNVDDRIAYYQPIVAYCKNLVTGSTYSESRVTVEDGNDFFRTLLADGFKRVSKRSFA